VSQADASRAADFSFPLMLRLYLRGRIRRKGRGMRAVAAARQWWAARRSKRVRSAGIFSGRHAADTAALASKSLHTIRISSLSLLLLAATAIACAAIGFLVTQSNDQRLSAERQVALHKALEDLRPIFGDATHFDGPALRLIEQQSGLAGLRFGTDPAPDSSREVQSVQDTRGRIVGWFSWMPDRTLIRAMDWLWSFTGAIGIALIFFAMMTGRASLRLADAFATSLEAVRRLTSEDALTGLPNQRVVVAGLDRALGEQGRGASSHVAFALVDPDSFREVNDTLGRTGGDAVMRAIATRLKAALPETALLGRFEDDEFAIVAGGNDADLADALAGTLRAAFADPIDGENTLHVSAAIGVVQAPQDGTTAEDLVRRAALTVDAAKREGRGVARRFAPQIENDQVEHRFLLRELKAAIAAQAFELHYQPIVAAARGTVLGVEALVRWRHPERGDIPPSAFIPLAERHGLMNELGEFVLRRALTDAARWPGLFVAVNLSPVQIREPHFVDLVRRILAETGADPARVDLEVTEGVLIENPDEVQKTLEALRGLGVSLALDDFGTGYSSLSYLQRFPFQRLKIDRAFVASLGAVGNAGAIVHSIVALGHALGMVVLAEGIETEQQRVLLRLAGCDEMQGYLFAEPRPAEAIDKIALRSASARGRDPQAAATPVAAVS
jgi:diguanylate cyclase (GGDEF)-like protein